MPLNGHGTKHVMPGRRMSPSPLLVFVSCVFFAREPSCFVVAASNLVSFYDLFLARARVSSRFVVESHLSSPFIVSPTLCGHAASNILLSWSRQPSYCWVLFGRAPVFNVVIWESMAQLTHCPRVRKRPQRVHKCSQAFQAAPKPSSKKCCRFWTVVAASRVKGANSHGAWGGAGKRCCFLGRAKS